MASEFAQEFSKVLKGMEKERISREKKSEDALILRETKREADLTKAEVKQQQQAETDANRQKEINQTPLNELSYQTFFQEKQAW